LKHEFESLSHPKAGVPSNQYVYRNVAGNLTVIANRYDKPEGGKFFLPFDVERGEWKAPASHLLYNLDKIAAADPATPIIFVEGEKCADALGDLGYLTTTTFGGSKAEKKSDLSPLAGRNVILWPDLDEAGLSYVQSVAETLYTLYKVNALIIPISYDTLCNLYVGEKAPTYRKGWDAADAVGENWGNEKIEKLIALALPYAPLSENQKKPEPINLDAMELWRTSDDEGFATLNIDGHFENWPIASNAFRNFLSYHHYKSEGKMLSQNALEDKRRTLLGEAQFAGDEHKVSTRIGEQGRSCPSSDVLVPEAA